jgi:C-terminal processing protease CtpA/Prc
MDRLATAPGVIFDLRGRPNSNDQVLSHLVTHLDPARSWEAIPLIIRPDRASTPASWEDTSSWNMPILQIRQPHISGRVAFLTGPRAISASEDIMLVVEHYHLGEIVGAATAGTDGAIAEIGEPTGCNTFFTGRLVTKMDGSTNHLIGVLPTIPAPRTIAGVLAGRDEVFDKALGYVRGTR